MDFEELLNLGREPGEDGLPDDYWDQLAGAHGALIEGHTTELGVRDSAIAERDTAAAATAEQLATLAATLQTVQAHNYDLMMQLEGTRVEPEGESGESAPIGENGDNVVGSESVPSDSIWEVAK